MGWDRLNSDLAREKLFSRIRPISRVNLAPQSSCEKADPINFSFWFEQLQLLPNKRTPYNVQNLLSIAGDPDMHLSFPTRDFSQMNHSKLHAEMNTCECWVFLFLVRPFSTDAEPLCFGQSIVLTMTCGLMWNWKYDMWSELQTKTLTCDLMLIDKTMTCDFDLAVINPHRKKQWFWSLENWRLGMRDVIFTELNRHCLCENLFGDLGFAPVPDETDSDSRSIQLILYRLWSRYRDWPLSVKSRSSDQTVIVKHPAANRIFLGFSQISSFRAFKKLMSSQLLRPFRSTRSEKALKGTRKYPDLGEGQKLQTNTDRQAENKPFEIESNRR
jgi:hypothetical protein